MATDPRITKAKRALKAGAEKAAKHKGNKKLQRSTATRAAYKAVHDAGLAALEILEGKPSRR